MGLGLDSAASFAQAGARGQDGRQVSCPLDYQMEHKLFIIVYMNINAKNK